MSDLADLLKLIATLNDSVAGIDMAERGAKLLLKDPCQCGKEGCGIARLQAKAGEFLSVLGEVRAEEMAKQDAARAVKETGKPAVQA